MLVARIAGCVFAVSVSSASGPSKHSFDSEKPERLVGLVEDGARRGIRVVERAAHADLLRALAGEQKRGLGFDGERHAHHLTAAEAQDSPPPERREQQEVALA